MLIWNVVFLLFSKLLLTVCQHTGKLFLAEKMACLSSQRLTEKTVNGAANKKTMLLLQIIQWFPDFFSMYFSAVNEFLLLTLAEGHACYCYSPFSF